MSVKYFFALSSPIFGKCCGEKVGEEKGNGKA